MTNPSLPTIISILLLSPSLAAAQNPDILEFYSQEAQVTTASRQPRTLRSSAATVYVVTAEDIKASGAQTLWDALRAVPGVDVMAKRTMNGDVSIRGLNRSSNNRTLILLDGKTLLNGFYDSITWESVPVTLEEIERIEVVEGPASALYGGNAVNGVINILTKKPQQLKGGLVSFTAGERNTYLASALHGDKKGNLDYKFGVGLHTGNRFNDASLLASKAVKFHSAAGYELSEDSRLSLSAGGSSNRTEQSPGSVVDGDATFIRADYSYGGTRLRGFWNRGRALSGSSLLTANLDYDTYDFNLEQSLTPHDAHHLVVGGNFRRNTARSSLFSPGLLKQDILGFFFEDNWQAHEDWALVASGRLDKHPLTSAVFSPRSSLIWTPAAEQSLRLTAGSSYRNPTIIENYIETDITINASPPPIRLISSNNKNLGPEKILFFELAHVAQFQKLGLRAAAFHYRLRNVIVPTVEVGAPAVPLPVTLSFANAGETRAWGGELAGEFAASSWATAFANYSYQQLKDDDTNLAQALSAPKHKLNGGMRVKRGGLTTNVSVYWVDKTLWRSNNALSSFVTYDKVPDYTLVNARVGYSFSGRWTGLEIALSAFNLLNRSHYETLPALGGEPVRARLSATASYRF